MKKPLNSRFSALQLSGRARMSLTYGVMLVLLAVWQAAPNGFPTVAGVRPFPLLAVAVCVAMFEGPVKGGVIGMSAGLLWDLYADRLFGFRGLLLLAIGCAVGLLVQQLLRNNLLSALLLSAGTCLAFTVLDWFFVYVLFRQPEALYILFRRLLPSAVYTWALTPLLYGLSLLAARWLRRGEKN